MALKKLNQFNYFDAEGFFSKLKLITVGSTVWKEYGSNVVKGTKLEVVIASDKHRYNSNSEASDKISPNDQGMFLMNTGVLFKAYYVEDDCLEGVDINGETAG